MSAISEANPLENQNSAGQKAGAVLALHMAAQEACHGLSQFIFHLSPCQAVLGCCEQDTAQHVALGQDGATVSK